MAVLLTQQPGTPTNFLASRSGDLTISPNALFPSPASLTNHFVAEMPRDLATSSHCSIPSGSNSRWSDVERRFTNLGGISIGSGHMSRPTGASFGAGEEAPWYSVGPDRSGNMSGEIVPPPGFTGGKSGRRLDGPQASSRPISREGSPSTRNTPNPNAHPM